MKAVHGLSKRNKSPLRIIAIFLAVIILLLISMFLSISIGSIHISFGTIKQAILNFDGSKEQSIIQTVRLPRLLVTAFVGANLAVAGALMQALTRNPLASPGIFGINAGASAAMVFLTVLVPGVSMIGGVFGAFLGGAVAAVIVYVMSSLIKGGDSDVKLALTGVAIQGMLMSLTQTLLIFNESKTEGVMFWLTGSVIGRDWGHVHVLLPFSIVGLIIAFGLGRASSLLSLGDDVARGLGQRVFVIRAFTAVVVIVLAGVSVAIAGPIGFVGLVVPHMVRYLIGVDYRVVLPMSALLGASLLLLADVLSRFITYPYETPVGAVTALLGTPYFIYLARRKKTERKA
ncbi:FecCD family ABC transporter permease [Priestia megaterium]|uniref:FecCD family ABC transporter permease n=1 Tax=Priestia megaterium TaxID=1404 RepID=UPI003CFC3A50